jgi:hypothetical protein
MKLNQGLAEGCGVFGFFVVVRWSEENALQSSIAETSTARDVHKRPFYTKGAQDLRGWCLSHGRFSGLAVRSRVIG